MVQGKNHVMSEQVEGICEAEIVQGKFGYAFPSVYVRMLTGTVVLCSVEARPHCRDFREVQLDETGGVPRGSGSVVRGGNERSAHAQSPRPRSHGVGG